MSPAGHRVHWEAVRNADVERTLTPPLGPWERLNDWPLTQTAFIDSGLTNGTAYSYRIRTVDTANLRSAAVSWVTVRPDAD